MPIVNSRYNFIFRDLTISKKSYLSRMAQNLPGSHNFYFSYTPLGRSSSVIDAVQFWATHEPYRLGDLNNPYYVAGSKVRLQAMIDYGILLFDKTTERDAVVNEINPFGHFNPHSAFISVGYESFTEPKDSSISLEDTHGQKLTKPSEIGQESFAHEEGRKSTIGEIEASSKQIKASDDGHETLLSADYDPSRFATITEEMLKGQHDPNRPSEIVDEMIEGQYVPTRVGVIDTDIVAFREAEPASFNLDSVGATEAQPIFITEDVLADLNKRLTFLSAGVIFGGRDERLSCISEMYGAAVRPSVLKDATIDSWMGFAKLVINQAILEDGMFALRPLQASDMLEDILAHLDPFPSDILEVKSYSQDARPSNMLEEQEAEPEKKGSIFLEDTQAYPEKKGEFIADFIAKKQEHYTELLLQIVSDKKKAETVMAEYFMAQKRVKDSINHPTVDSSKAFKDSLLENIYETGQGFIYNYDNDILDNSVDIEEWSGGYGIPEDYDPADPFNEYYPWTTNKNPLALGQSDWVRFDYVPSNPGQWDRNQNLGEFSCTTVNPNVTGFFLNDFTHTEYQFETAFMVEDITTNDGVGIVFKYIDSKNHYLFMVSGGDSNGSLGMSRAMQLYKVVNGVSTEFGSPMTPFNWSVGFRHVIKMSLAGNRTKIWVDNRLQYEIVE